MARSAYVYVVEDRWTSKIVAAFPFHDDLVSWLEQKHETEVGMLYVHRFRAADQQRVTFTGLGFLNGR